MNVLKADFIPKQKRLQNRRQKVIRTFFSGYRTISDIVPATSFIRFLPTDDMVPKSEQFRFSPRFPINVSNIGKTAKCFDMGSSDAKLYDIGKSYESCDKKDNTTSSSLEFQKLLEPFLSFKQKNLSDLSAQLVKQNNDNKSIGKIVQNSRVTKEDCLDSFFQSHKLYSAEESLKWKKSPKQIKDKTPRQFLNNSSEETFEYCNRSIFNYVRKSKQFKVTSQITQYNLSP